MTWRVFDDLALHDMVCPVLVPCYDLSAAASFLFSCIDAMETQAYDFHLPTFAPPHARGQQRWGRCHPTMTPRAPPVPSPADSARSLPSQRVVVVSIGSQPKLHSPLSKVVKHRSSSFNSMHGKLTRKLLYPSQPQWLHAGEPCCLGGRRSTCFFRQLHGLWPDGVAPEPMVGGTHAW